MKNWLKKVLCLLTAIALLVSGAVLAFAENADELPEEAQKTEAAVDAAPAEGAADTTEAEIPAGDSSIIVEEIPADEIIPAQDGAAEEIPAGENKAEGEDASVPTTNNVETPAEAQEADQAPAAADGTEAPEAADEANASETTDGTNAPEAIDAPAAAEGTDAKEESEAGDQNVTNDAPAAAEGTDASADNNADDANNTPAADDVNGETEIVENEIGETENGETENEDQAAAQEAKTMEETETAETEAAAAEASEGQADSTDDGIMVIDGPGQLDPEIVDEFIIDVNDPSVKYDGATELKLNETVSGVIDSENSEKYYIKCGSNKTFVLGLAATAANVEVRIDGTLAAFEKIENEENSEIYLSSYVLPVTTGSEYYIVLSSSETVAYTLTAEDADKAEAVEEKVEVAEETEAAEETEKEDTAEEETNTEEDTAAEEGKEENTGAIIEDADIEDEILVNGAEEESEENNDEENNDVEESEESKEESEEAEDSEESEESEENEESEEAKEEAESEESKEDEESEEKSEEAEESDENKNEDESEEEGIKASGIENKADKDIIKEEAPVVTGRITVDTEVYGIGDTITLTAELDGELNGTIVWQTKVQNEEKWMNAGAYGETLAVTITEENAANLFRFRMAEDNYSEEFQLTITEKEIEAVVEKAAAEEEKEIEEAAEEVEEEEEIVEKPENSSVTLQIEWDEEKPHFGSVAHYVVTMEGYEGYEYTLEWQYSTDLENWITDENASGERMDLIVTPENNNTYWRVVVKNLRIVEG